MNPRNLAALLPRMKIRFALRTFLFALLSLATGMQGHSREIISVTSKLKTLRGGASSQPAISSDGRYVAFASFARLVPEDKNRGSDVYIKDRETGEIRLVSGPEGGDQPSITSDGRRVIFRAFTAIPKIRVVDLDLLNPARTISYAFGGGRSFRAADSAVITPDGRFASFAFRPVSILNGSSDVQLCVNDTTENTESGNGSFSVTENFLLETLEKSAIRRDGEFFFAETSDAIAGFDTNGVTDVYGFDRADNFVRLSATDSGLEETGAAHSPAVSADGSFVFFISERRLRATDDDETATLYFSSAATGYSIPTPFFTPGIVPIALSPQAVSDSRYLVFLGKPKKGPARPYLLDLISGETTQLAPSATGAPVISADQSSIAFATRASLLPGDPFPGEDIYVVNHPDASARLPAPGISISAGPAEGQVFTETANISFNATASTPGMANHLIALEIDGVVVFRSSGGSLSTPQSLSRGEYTYRILAWNNANVFGASAPRKFIVRPVTSSPRIRHFTPTVQTPQKDGSIRFSTSLTIDNNTAGARGPFQLVITQAPTPGKWEFFGDESLVALPNELVLDVIEVPSLAAGFSTVIPIENIARPPEVVGDGFQGLGWSIFVRLREASGLDFVDRDSRTLLALRPPLDEDTPGPNGGIPVLGTPVGEGGFNPAILQSVTIQGPNRIPEQRSTRLSATANFNTGSKPCTPEWSILQGGAFASISPGGAFSAKAVASPQKVVVQARFRNQTDTKEITVRPVSPIIAVRALSKTIEENGTDAAFRFIRSGPQSEAITVQYEVSGTASAGDDFAALSGSIAIDAGASSATLPITLFDDPLFEGNETLIITILDSPDYQVRSGRTARLTLIDNEQWPSETPDVVLRLGSKQIGKDIIEFEAEEQKFTIQRRARQTTKFTYFVSNNGDADATYRLEGSSSFLGFNVRYFEGNTDVTSAIVEGTFEFDNVPPGASRSLSVRITPTASAPIGTTFRCILQTSASGVDRVEMQVRRK
jgi:hypothetical protein